VTYHFDDISEQLQESIKKYVNLNLYVNPDVDQPLLKPYFKKIFTNKPDAEISANVHMGKNKSDRFDGMFSFTVDWHPIRYERVWSESFKNPVDLVNHAFIHFKREVTWDKGMMRKLLWWFKK
jgi:hypothetical protein